MGSVDERDYWVPEHVREYLRRAGFILPLEAMEGHIRDWHAWMESSGSFYDYHDSDGFGRVYEVHRRSIHPAMRVCREWGSLLLNDKTQVVCESQDCTDWLVSFFKRTGFFPSAQATVVRAFGMGTGAWALWVDTGRRDVRVKRYDARMVIPLSWDEEVVTECAFVTRAFYRGRAIDQLQMHVLGNLGDEDERSERAASVSASATSGLFSPSWHRGGQALDGVVPSESSPSISSESSGSSFPPNSATPMPSTLAGNSGVAPSVPHPSMVHSAGPSSSSIADGSGTSSVSGSSPSPYSPECEGPTYRIVTVCFDEDGSEIEVEGVCAEYDTGCPFPTFAIVKPAVENTRVDMSPYGQSVFADAIDAIQAVDLTFDALINEVDAGKMRVFLSDVLFDREQDGKKGKPVSIPFGRQDCTVFRKVMSAEDTIQEFAPALRTKSQVEAFRVALQVLGDLCDLGIKYFDYDHATYMKTATEVSSDNSALMRNIARHEHAIEQSIATICRALLFFARKFGVELADEGDIRVTFDDSIISDTAAEKRQDIVEVGLTMAPHEYRQKWYGESEDEARRRAGELSDSA